MRKMFIYRFGVVAIIACCLSLMPLTAISVTKVAASPDLEGLKGPIHALDEIEKVEKQKAPSIWV